VIFGPPLYLETLTVRRVERGAPDADGVPTETVTETPWGPCNVQQATTDETAPPTQQVTDRLQAIGPLAPDIRPGDLIVRDGLEHHIEGAPAHYRGVLDHTELVMTRWEG